jgi:hypothetical protein
MVKNKKKSQAPKKAAWIYVSMHKIIKQVKSPVVWPKWEAFSAHSSHPSPHLLVRLRPCDCVIDTWAAISCEDPIR